MQEKLFDFLSEIFGRDRVALAYGDKVTTPGLSVIFYESSTDTVKQLDGTTNYLVGNYLVQIWDETSKKVLEGSKKLFLRAEGTEYQIQSMRSARMDRTKKKWHRDIVIRIMEDVEYARVLDNN